MKKFISTKTGGIIFLTILALPFLLYSPVVDYVNSRYAEPRECTLESARFSKGGTSSRVGSSKNKVAIETAECGTVVVTGIKGSEDSLLEDIDTLNSYQGEKLTFMFGPLSWNPGNRVAESVTLPD